MLTKKVIRHNVGENKVSFAQTSKGLWYCTELTMYCKDPLDGIQYLAGAMLVVEEVLKERKGEGWEGCRRSCIILKNLA